MRRITKIALTVATAATLVLPTAAATASVPEQVNPGDGIEQGIVGGKESTKAYSWMVSLEFPSISAPPYAHYCGGALVAAKWVVTAQHCTSSMELGKDVARVGSLDNKEGGEIIKIKRKLLPTDKYSDIAVLELEQASKKTPIKIPKERGKVGSAIRMLGFGATSANGMDTPRKLKELDTTMFDPAKCKNNEDEAKQPYRPKSEICVGNTKKGEGACRGDSGGPLVRQLAGKQEWVLIGDTSRGPKKCGTAPSIYTDVASYRSWVSQQTGGAIGNAPAEG